MAKHANGEGSIYAKGKGYEGAVTLTAPDGTKVRRSARGATKGDVRAKLDALRKAAESGVVTTDPKVTVAVYAERWLAGPLETLDVRESTRTQYRWLTKQYVIPTFGHIRLVGLTPAAVEEGLVRLSKRDLAKNTVRLTKVMLGKICESAERDGLTVRNPVRSARLPRGKAPKAKQAMSAEQVETLLRHLEGGPLHAPVMLAVSTGLRPGEVLALKWADFDLEAERPTLRVVEAKTARGRRVVPLTSQLPEMLRRHRAEQAKARLAAGPLWVDTGLVFPSSIGTKWDIANYRHMFQKACRDAGLGHWTPHELRHTTASWLIAKGIPLKMVSETLGHSGISITADVYGHLLGPSYEVADVLGSMLPPLSAIER